MSRSILRKGKDSQLEMEGESQGGEPFLKIETIWSENEEKFGQITIKEEDISDCEPESLLCQQSENNYNCKPVVKIQNIDEGKINENEFADCGESDKLPKRDKDKRKKGKVKGVSDAKEVCVHDAKNFKVIKKRLHCVDCKSVLCPECYCTICSSLQTHFSKSDNNNRSLYPCKLCSMIFRSNCALQAHVRIHLLDTPYVCPDCGATYNNIYFLSLHLINKCYHVYKVITNGCKFCLSQNMAPDEYLSHIEKSHIKPIYKCSHCGLMFESTREMNRHLGTSHKNEKASSLNYFCCLMCGNLIISKHLYSKHIKYHQDHSAAFQIGYLCPCGSSYNSASSFRAHFKSCNKKGVLPPQWTYLQVTLKTHEMLQAQNTIQKNSLLQSQSLLQNSIECDGEALVDQEKMDCNLFEDGDSSEELDDQSEGIFKGISDESESCKSKSNAVGSGKGVGNRNPSHPGGGQSKRIITIDLSNSEKKGNNKNKIGNVQEDYADVRKSKTAAPDAPDGSDAVVQNSPCPGRPSNEVLEVSRGSTLDYAEMITERSGLIPNVQLVEEFSQETIDEGHLRENYARPTTNSEKVDRCVDKGVKIMYDHIPCDHLGYLKVHQFSNGKKDAKIDSRKNSDQGDGHVNSDSENYIITSVLDEKTGLMKTNRLHVPKGKVDHSDLDKTGNAADEMEISEIFPNVHCRELSKPRSSTFFSCPFCSVLFPKHYSSFQRFRLHLECYHPDASLDITVDRTQVPKSQTKFTSIRIDDDFDSDDDLFDLDNVDLQTRLNESLKETYNMRKQSQNGFNDEKRKKDVPLHETGAQERSESDPRFRSGKHFEGKDRENVENASEKSDGSRYERNIFGRRDRDKTLRSSSSSSSSSKNYKCKSVDDSLLNHDSKQGFKDQNEKGDEMFCGGGSSSDVQKETTSMNSVVQHNEESSETVDSENSSRGARSNQSTGDENDVTPPVEEVVGAVKDKRRNTLLKKPFSVMNSRGSRNSLSKDKFPNDCGEESNDCNEDKFDDGSVHFEDGSNANSKICRVRTLSGKERYFKNFSNDSKVKTEELASMDSSQSDNAKQSLKDETPHVRGHSSERRNSRRESDVWSEFYKTLKIAETLKKTKVKNREKDKGDGRETSILTNYTNKRVVKKPKRYRGSSDSDDSMDDGKSPGESKIFKEFDGRIAPACSNDPDDDELYIKKKKLLNRLENVDNRIVEYICDLIDNKERAYGLMKKNSDVRGCRKKCVNGLKLAARQPKVSPSGENDEEMSRDYFGSVAEKEVTHFNYDEIDWDARSTLEDKNCDKRRGRPKKGDALILRERRKSDFDREVNFIEKNFEADENDFFTNKRKRKLSSKLQYYKKMSSAAEKNDFSSGQVISTKNMESDRKLSCAVCKESYQSEVEFREHIQVHRMDENNHQCMECGECFVVRPSLEKHLHAFHKIKDVQKYIEENECSAVEKSEEVDCEPLKENQCKVCRDEFASAHDLNKHFRIHGMAFLRQFKKDTKSH